jgi:hypothetical protein
MPAFGLPHCFNMRQQFPPVDQNFIADGNIEQSSNHTHCRRRDFPQRSAFCKFSEKHEFGSSSTFMEPSFFTKATDLSRKEERNPPKPPKFLAENCNRQAHHGSVSISLPVSDSVSSSSVHFRCYCFPLLQPLYSYTAVLLSYVHFGADFDNTALLCCYSRLAYLFNIKISS